MPVGVYRLSPKAFFLQGEGEGVTSFITQEVTSKPYNRGLVSSLVSFIRLFFCPDMGGSGTPETAKTEVP